MDCTLKFMKEYNLRSMNKRATITQDRGFGFGFVFPELVEEMKSLPGHVWLPPALPLSLDAADTHG